MKEIPFTTAELILKQLELAQLNELGQAAMSRVFTGYLDRSHSEETIAKWKAEQEEWSGFQWDFDSNPYRRYAGDVSLPRARYYSVADAEDGQDRGTLVRELRAYYNARRAGIVQIWDSTEPKDAQFLARIVRLDSPQIVLLFLPLAGKPNPFAAQFSDRPKTGMMALLPLTVKKVRADKVINLRLPGTAEWFAKALSRAEWDVGGKMVKAFAMRPPLESFRQLIPALLEQSVGGAGFTNLVGIWLRKLGAKGFVFPSARVDAGVETWDGDVVSSTGFCFVDYSNAPPPLLDAFLDVVPEWPTQIQATPEGPGDSRKPLEFGNVQIHYEDSGCRRGSWEVTGLRKMRELIWRISMLGAVIETLPSPDSRELNKTLIRWLLFSGLDVDVAGPICQLLQEGLMGIPGQVQNLARLVQDVRQRGESELYDALQQLFEASQKQGATADG